jgi:hypothetical protein
MFATAERAHSQSSSLSRSEDAKQPARQALNPAWQALALRPVAIQPKLSIGQANDPYEQEADRVAERVMQMPAPRTEGGFEAGRNARGATGSLPKLSAGAMLQRQALPTPSQMIPCPANELDAAIVVARRWASQAIPVITSLNARVQAGNIGNLTDRELLARQEILNMFQIDISNPAHAGFLQQLSNRATTTQAVLAGLTPAQFRCVTQQYPDCGPAFRTEAFVSGGLPVYLCITTFQQVGRHDDPLLKAPHTVVHEAAHVAGAMGASETYSSICSPYVLGPVGVQEALGNAEHYACLIRVLR